MRLIHAGSLAAVLVCVSLASAELVAPRSAQLKERIAPLSVRAYTDSFKADENAQAIVSGDGGTILALYVFDSAGNCVARDDVPTPESSDDLFAQWLPASTGRFAIEVRNAGLATWRNGEIDVTTYKLGIR